MSPFSGSSHQHLMKRESKRNGNKKKVKEMSYPQNTITVLSTLLSPFHFQLFPPAMPHMLPFKTETSSEQGLWSTPCAPLCWMRLPFIPYHYPSSCSCIGLIPLEWTIFSLLPSNGHPHLSLELLPCQWLDRAQIKTFHPQNLCSI